MSAASVSPQVRARWAGVFESLEGQASAWGQVFILNRLIVRGDAAATASKLLAHEGLYRLGFTLSALGAMFHVVWIWLFYQLLKPVSRTGSLLAAWVGVLSCALQAGACVFYLTPLTLLKGAPFAGAFQPRELQTLSYLCLRLNGDAFNLYLAFFGAWCAVTGYLIARSTFLPRIIGWLLMVDGLGWILFLVPPVAARLFPFIGAASGLAEIPLVLWLLVKGVNQERWRAQAGAEAPQAP